MSLTNSVNCKPLRTIDANSGNSEKNRKTDDAASSKSHGKMNRGLFFNLLRKYGMQNKELTSTEGVVQGRQKWRLMSDTDKLLYRKKTFTLPKRAPQNQPRQT